MNPIIGGRREFLWLLALMGVVPMIAYGRKSNEDGLRSEVKATNRYAKMTLDEKSRKLW